MEENLPVPQAVQKKRPTGVWVLTIYALIAAGILPLLVEIYFLVSGDAAENKIASLLSVALSIGVIISAIGAWKGIEKVRKPLLGFVTLYYVFIAINRYTLISSGQVLEDGQIRMWIRLISYLLNPVAFIWYFTLDATKEFYK